jgi:glycosyltransferase involved in cell wall biosynthesis
MTFMEKIAAQKAKNNLAVSQGTKEEMTAYYHIPPEKITVFNNFVDEKIFYPAAGERARDTGNIRILFCGRLETRKGLGMLKKLSDYIEKIEGFSLSIACNNERNTSLFHDNKKTYIQIGLEISDLCAFYNSGDILFFPTIHEGFSMSTLEALCCGIPVLGTGEAIKDGLRNYEFIHIADTDELNDFPELTRNIRMLVDKYHDKKEEIHQVITRDFGYEQYEKKLFSLINTGYKTK